MEVSFEALAGLSETMSFDHKNMAGNEDLIKRLFNKVYSAILSEKIFCPPETAVYLAAYACQAKFGPAQSLRNPVPPVKDLLPKSTLDNHNLSITEWEERISKWHLKLRDTSFLDAIVEYLDIAQDVELYGASIFEVETKNQGRQWISLDAVGLNVYDSKRKPPTKRYIWSDIASFSAWDDRIEIALVHEPKQVTFFVQNSQTCSLLESLFKGSKELYARRRKGDVSSKYVRRSESNSSMRMRPHKLTPMELLALEQQITELELELPRRATNYEYAAWQVKDQLRQARGIEIKLSLNVPSTDETRLLQHRVAQIRVFLEQDFFKEKEPTDRPHRYRGNFAIRIGGTLTSRSDDYCSDIDSGSERNDVPPWTLSAKPLKKDDHASVPKWNSSSKPSQKGGQGSVPGWNASIISQQDGQVKTTPSQPRQQPLPQPSAAQNATPNSVTSSSETEGHGYVEHPYPSGNKQQLDPPQSTMPDLPESLLLNHMNQPKSFTSDASKKPATYNPDAYPKFPDRPMNPLAPTQPPLKSTGSIQSGPGYPDARGSEEMDPPGSATSPNVWKHVLRTPGQDPSDQLARGRIHGQLVEPEDVQLAYRPPIQPKPKVAPRGTADPRMVLPDYYAGVEASRGPGQDPKFSSLKVIQSGYTKKRVDLFEAL
ncbi:ezrin [Echinococcus multilocularis]|uniref:Ezrin n=1 Tax=Echinococcus multilocularis TaxID=6211 RepID=A0A068Y6H9_ECHMU|nr:ezrin [Echinococcus multilocularis]